MVIARERAILAKLTNITCLEENIVDYEQQFDLGIGLHACGIATDIIIDK
jgi:hypothetical protein